MNKKVMKLASREKRLGAFLIDQVIPVVSVIVAFTALTSLTAVNYFMGGYGNSITSGIFSLIAIAVAICISIAYLGVEIYFYTKSMTIGKAILKMQVVSCSNGEPIGFWKMLLREWFAKRASEIICYLGYIWILIDDKNRGWHDKIMDTYVVDLKESEALMSQEQQNATDTSVQAGFVTETNSDVVEPVTATGNIDIIESAVSQNEIATEKSEAKEDGEA